MFPDKRYSRASDYCFCVRAFLRQETFTNSNEQHGHAFTISNTVNTWTTQKRIAFSLTLIFSYTKSIYHAPPWYFRDYIMMPSYARFRHWQKALGWISVDAGFTTSLFEYTCDSHYLYIYRWYFKWKLPSCNAVATSPISPTKCTIV